MNTLHKSADKFRVILVEDHPMFREQLAHLIAKETDMSVCGEADNARDALDLLESKHADIVIVDLTLKGTSGLELLKDLKARGIRVPVLVLSMHDELLYAERVLRAGARGYITKHETAKEVMAAIRKVLAGEIYLGTRMAARVFESFSAHPTSDDGFALLTDRELEVFELIGHGRSTRDISGLLHLGMSTVDTYRTRIKAKLHLENASQLYHEAIRWVSAGQNTPI
ncbi:MAG: DNA-binding response regulator [Verrucomicrobia bacterium]|nr:MAG: DNA-binding response regulator [Verrucomicrobiota bacterium]